MSFDAIQSFRKHETESLKMQVRIVGLGTMSGNEVCKLSGTKATGYIEIDGEMVPCNLTLLGPGSIGEFVYVPKDLERKLLLIKTWG